MICKKCQHDKSKKDFYPYQQHECKECVRARVRNNRRKNIDYYRAYDRERGNRQDADYVRKYREANPEKWAAHIAVGNALRDGHLKKDPCFMCGSEKVEGHHPDYSKPLDVIWLCPGCHKSIHAYEDRANEIRSSE